MKPLTLSLQDDTFSNLKIGFDSILKQTIADMKEKNGDTADITLKLKITFEKKEIIGQDGTPEDVIVPRFEHKISSAIQVKNSIDGALIGDYSLQWDNEKFAFVLKKIKKVDDGQITFDDDDESEE